MTCADALDRMLVADPAVLGGHEDGDPDLAGHLAECGRCSRVAAALVDEMEALDEGLDALAEGVGAGGPGRSTDAGSEAGTGVIPLRRPRRRSRWAWVPLAAAAALGGVLVVGRSGPEGAGPSGPATAADPEPRVAVTLPADRGAAVMQTTNPNITVVWLYERSER